MTEFQTALNRFLSGKLDLPGLEATLARTLQQDPASAELSLQALDHLFRSSRLPARTYIALKQLIPDSLATDVSRPASPGTEPPSQDLPNAGATHAPTVPGAVSTEAGTSNENAATPPADSSSGGQVTSPPPAAAPPPQTDESSAILDILGPDASASPPDAGQADVAPGPADEEAKPADDKTVFRQASSPSPSALVAGTGGYATTGGVSMPTGQTGQTGQTGTGAGTGTGTGSNWTDPSRWGAGPAPTMQPGSILKDRYVLEVVIGRGGMGVVFKARDLRREEAQDRNPYVAVKILNDEFRRHPESLKALQRESRKAQDLAHPNIVTVFDFDRDGPIVYMTMEYLEGKSLDKLAKSATFDGMPMSETYALVEGLGFALAYAHGKGIVHSDFKPANVFLTDGGDVKVFDFGIARAAKLSDDKAGEMTLFDPGSLGALTPAYASCEMLDGEEPDPRDDIYALACLTYELLTGKHPFNKRSAAEARDKKLPLAPIKGLTRRQWRGIERGLAFRRTDRSPNVDSYLDDIRPRKINKAGIGLAAAAVLVLASIGMIFLPTYLEGRRIDNVIALIGDSSPTDMPAVLDRLAALESTEQDAVRGNSAVRTRLIDYYATRIGAAQDALEYPLAETLAETGLAIYPDSNRLISARDDLASGKAALLSDLLNRFNAHLQAGRLLPGESDDITDVFAEYEKIDPDNPTLSDPRLAIAYANAAEQAVATDIGLAERYLAEWQQRFPGDPLFAGLRDRVNTIRDVQNREARVTELREQLSQQLPGLASPEDMLAVEADVVQLAALEPDDAVVREYQQRAEALTVARLAELLADNDWLGAERQLVSMQQLVGGEFRAAQSAAIAAAQADYRNRIDGMLAAITAAVQERDFPQAEASLVQLGEQGADASAIREARSAISRGYLDSARTLRTANNFDEARAMIEAGDRADPVFTDWQLELNAINSAREAFESGIAEQEDIERNRIRLARIDELETQIESSLALAEFDVDIAIRTLATIDELGRLDPTSDLAVTGRREVAAKLATAANAQGFEDGDWDAAIALATRSIEILPGESVLRDARANLERERNSAVARQAADEDSDLRANLEQLLASPDFGNGRWESALRSNIQSLAQIAGAADYLQAKRAEIAQAYLEQAESLLAENRFAVAEQRLDSSEWFVPGFDPAQEVRQRLATVRATFEAETRNRQQAAEIEGLKRTFTTDLNAERIPNARIVLEQLRQMLPANDRFLTADAPQMIADTFQQMAERAMSGERFDTAEQLAQEGLREVANHPGLSALLGRIAAERLAVTVATLEDILGTADPGDPAGPRNLLAQIRADAGDGYAEIETGLRTLATQRISGARANRDALIGWISGIFDGFVPPQAAGPGCTRAMQMAGRRARAQCYDFLPDTTTRGPRLVVIPGVNDGDGPFAITRQEISVGEWNDYCRLSGDCAPRTNADDQVPVTSIELSEAVAYASWLTANTNYTYRLPTENEWVRAATADGNNGVNPNCVNPQAGTGDRLLEVNRGGQNAWGVMNYIGNAQEWVRTASGDIVARGGAFRDRLGNCTIETSRPHSGSADDMTGFRLVRDGVENS